MNSGSITPYFVSLLVGVAGTYAAFYVHGALARREQIAKSLAAFYASAATVYYAARDLPRKPSESETKYLAFYKLFDEHYQEFLSSSTVLASLVPPVLRDKVLRIEDLWDEIGGEGFAAVSEKKWFDALDAIREEILNSISYSRLIDPFWK